MLILRKPFIALSDLELMGHALAFPISSCFSRETPPVSAPQAETESRLAVSLIVSKKDSFTSLQRHILFLFFRALFLYFFI